MDGDGNKRNHRRRPLDVAVRFVTSADLESAGRLEDISEGGLRMKTAAAAEIGDTIIAYPEGLGRLTGTIIRKDAGEIAVAFDLSDNQRVYLAKRIESALTGIPYLKLLEKRAHQRLDLNIDSSVADTLTGETFECRIVNLSATGAQVQSDYRPPVGSEVRIGEMRGNVVRLDRDGFALAFERAPAA